MTDTVPLSLDEVHALTLHVLTRHGLSEAHAQVIGRGEIELYHPNGRAIPPGWGRIKAPGRLDSAVLRRGRAALPGACRSRVRCTTKCRRCCGNRLAARKGQRKNAQHGH
jgi:hypothetical protein